MRDTSSDGRSPLTPHRPSLLVKLGASPTMNHVVSAPLLQQWGATDADREAIGHVQTGEFADSLAGRVARIDRTEVRVVLDQGELRCSDGGCGPLAVGDFVLAEMEPRPGELPAVRALIDRRSTLARSAGPAALPQVVAANLDEVMIAVALDQPFAPERLERLLASAFDGGSVPRILLTKADLDGAADRLDDLRPLARGVTMQAISLRSGEGLEQLREALVVGRTAALVGSSGAGKSSLINALLGTDYAPVGEVRERDGKGRHTTSWRELIRLPSGGVVIDTPGMRSLGLWIRGEGIEETFDDVEALAARCKFSDCAHGSEPGCVIREAIGSGELDGRRFESYLKLIKEAEFVALRNDARATRERDKAGNAVAQDGRSRARRR